MSGGVAAVMLSGKVQPVLATTAEVEAAWAILCDGATEARFDESAFNAALMRCGCALSIEEQSACLAPLSIESDDSMSMIRFLDMLKACGVEVPADRAEGPEALAADAGRAQTVDDDAMPPGGEALAAVAGRAQTVDEDAMPPGEASAHLAFPSPTSIWGAEAPGTVSPTLAVGQEGEQLGACAGASHGDASGAASSEVRPQRFAPEVDPASLPAEQRADANATLAAFEGLAKDAHAVLHDRVEAAFAEMQKALPTFLQSPDAGIRETWAASAYFPLMDSVVKEWQQRCQSAGGLSGDSGRIGTGTLVPDVAPSSLSRDARIEAEQVLTAFGTLPEEARTMLRERVEAGFEATLKQLPPFLQADPGAMKTAWLREHYFDIMKSVAEEWPHAQSAPAFVPELLPEDVPARQRVEAEDLVRTFPPAAEQLLRQRVDSAFREACVARPKSFSMPTESVRKAWLREEYYNVVKIVRDEFLVTSPPQRSGSKVRGAATQPAFEPEVLPAALPVVARKRAEAVLRRFPVAAQNVFRDRVSKEFDAMWAALPAAFRGAKDQIRAGWLAAEYYELMERTTEEWHAQGPR